MTDGDVRTDDDVSRIELEANLAEVAAARRFVRAALAEVPPPVVDDVQLIASELVTNAIEHGPGGPVIVELECTDAVVQLTVQSPNPPGDIEDPRRWTIPSASAMSGRGFGIVRQVADWVEVRRNESFLTVVAHRRI